MGRLCFPGNCNWLGHPVCLALFSLHRDPGVWECKMSSFLTVFFYVHGFLLRTSLSLPSLPWIYGGNETCYDKRFMGLFTLCRF